MLQLKQNESIQISFETVSDTAGIGPFIAVSTVYKS